mgnify:CR=1 FL=1
MGSEMCIRDRERNREAECIMNSQNSVAIHIRKGVDYLRNPIFSGICPIEYYHEAIKYVREHVDNPIFYVFTDNKEWVLNNLTDLNYTISNSRKNINQCCLLKVPFWQI